MKDRIKGICLGFVCVAQVFSGIQAPEKASDQAQKSRVIESIPTARHRLFEFDKYSIAVSPLGEDLVHLQSYDESVATYTRGDELVRLSLYPLKVLEKPSPIPERRVWHERFQMKYRNGTWYYRVGLEVRRLNPDGKGWVVALKPSKNYSQFEVAPDGQILLIGSSEPQVPSTVWALDAAFDISKEGSAKFLSMYSEGSEKPGKELDLPADLEFVEKHVNRITGPNHSFWVGSTLIMHSAEMGRIWCFDSVNGGIRELDTPWVSLNRAFLEKHWSKTKKLKTKDHSVGIPADLFPFVFEFFPSGMNSVQLVVRWQEIRPEYKDDLVKELKNVMAEEYIDFDLRGPKTEIYELDLTDFRIKKHENQELDVLDLAKIKGPYLILSGGMPVRFPGYSPPQEVIEEKKELSKKTKGQKPASMKQEAPASPSPKGSQ